MEQVHNFKDSLAKAHEGEIDEILASAGWTEFREMQGGTQTWGIDRIAHLHGQAWSLEYKADTAAAKYGNFFMETRVARDGDNDLGWTKYTVAQLLVEYIKPLGELYIIPMLAVKKALPGWERDYELKGPVKNTGGLEAFGYAVPIPEVVKLAWYKIEAANNGA